MSGRRSSSSMELSQKNLRIHDLEDGAQADTLSHARQIIRNEGFQMWSLEMFEQEHARCPDGAPCRLRHGHLTHSGPCVAQEEFVDDSAIPRLCRPGSPYTTAPEVRYAMFDAANSPFNPLERKGMKEAGIAPGSMDNDEIRANAAVDASAEVTLRKFIRQEKARMKRGS